MVAYEKLKSALANESCRGIAKLGWYLLEVSSNPPGTWRQSDNVNIYIIVDNLNLICIFIRFQFVLYVTSPYLSPEDLYLTWWCPITSRTTARSGGRRRSSQTDATSQSARKRSWCLAFVIYASSTSALPIDIQQTMTVKVLKSAVGQLQLQLLDPPSHLPHTVLVNLKLPTSSLVPSDSRNKQQQQLVPAAVEVRCPQQLQLPSTDKLGEEQHLGDLWWPELLMEAWVRMRL